jgi:hypothetical protein
VEEYARKGRLGLIAFGAYNAFGLIGPEQGGVALVDEKLRQVLGTIVVPYSREKRGVIFERIFGSRDWFIAAREAGFGMRFERQPNPLGLSYAERLAEEAKAGKLPKLILESRTDLDGSRHWYLYPQGAMEVTLARAPFTQRGLDRLKGYAKKYYGVTVFEGFRSQGNPGEAWHLQEADEAKKLRAAGHTQSFRDYYEGQEAAHLHSAYESKSKHLNPEEPDQDSVRELDLFAENTFALYSQFQSIIKNLQHKMVKGTYDPVLAPQLWRFWYDNAARLYKKEFGYGFSPAVRQQAAVERARDEEQKIRGGEYRENPTPADGFRTFHHADPDRNRAVQVPKGWPRQLWMLGSLKKLELASGQVVRGGTVAASRGNKMYVLGARYSGKLCPRARAVKIEYVTPSVSERAGPVWYHPFKRPPAVREWTRGYLTLAGKGIKLTRRGIVG